MIAYRYKWSQAEVHVKRVMEGIKKGKKMFWVQNQSRQSKQVSYKTVSENGEW